MNLFTSQSFTSHSGLHLDWKIECDALSESDLSTLAKIIVNNYKFGEVIGIPRGGLRLADKLEPYRIKDHDVILIVDDVLTTGKSMNNARKEIEK